jgi:hypothetical protein
LVSIECNGTQNLLSLTNPAKHTAWVAWVAMHGHEAGWVGTLYHAGLPRVNSYLHVRKLTRLVDSSHR